MSFDNSFFDSGFVPNLDGLSPPAPASGSALLDDQENLALFEFMDNVGSDQYNPSISDSNVLRSWDMIRPDFHGNFSDIAALPGQPLHQSFDMLREQADPANSAVVEPAASHTLGMATTMSSQFRTAQLLAQQQAHEFPLSLPYRGVNVADHPSMQPHTRISLQWGSDPHFQGSGYNPPMNHGQLQSELQIQEKILSSLESVHTSGGNSPNNVKDEVAVSDGDENSNTPAEDSASTPDSVDVAVYAHRQLDTPRKRAKYAHSGDALGSFNETSRKQSKKSAQRRPSSDSGGKGRRRSSVLGLNAKKDNLSEAQKRENHIHSEQKRRNLIRQGFDDLCLLVPELRGGGYSKSAVLVHAASYLERLEHGNDLLRGMLRRCQVRS